MKQHPQPWKHKHSPNYYFSYTNGSGRRRIKSTRARTKKDARDFIARHMQKVGQNPDTLKQYAAPFYKWDECPHIRRLLDENKSIGKEHSAHCRSLLEKYILRDPMAEKRLTEIRRGDLLDFRTRMRLTHNDSMANRTMGVLKTIFKEALFRQDIDYDPTAGIGLIKTATRTPGTFTEHELDMLFNRDNFPNERQYILFLLASEAALRRGEILELQWGDIDPPIIRVSRARKGKETGAPKWGKIRIVAMSERLEKELEAYRRKVGANRPDDLVISWIDGTPIATRSVNRWFDEAMERLGVDKKGRNLSPHSFRHTRISLWKQMGMPQGVLQTMVGHTEEKTTEGYVHYAETYLSEIVRKLST